MRDGVRREGGRGGVSEEGLSKEGGNEGWSEESGRE